MLYVVSIDSMKRSTKLVDSERRQSGTSKKIHSVIWSAGAAKVACKMPDKLALMSILSNVFLTLSTKGHTFSGKGSRLRRWGKYRTHAPVIAHLSFFSPIPKMESSRLNTNLKL